MKWFNFRQNNSGGSFVFRHGIGVEVWIEAKNAADANERAESIGLYFDGAGDCPCCGDRWYPAWDAGEDQLPEAAEFITDWAAREGGDATYAWAHHVDGRVEKLPTRRHSFL